MTIRDALESLFSAWRSGDALRACAHFAADARYREARRAPLDGRAAIVEHFTKFFRDGPAWRFSADDVLVEGERAAVRYRFEVASATGRFEQEGCALVTFANGTIIEWREYEG